VVCFRSCLSSRHRRSVQEYLQTACRYHFTTHRRPCQELVCRLTLRRRRLSSRLFYSICILPEADCTDCNNDIEDLRRDSEYSGQLFSVLNSSNSLARTFHVPFFCSVEVHWISYVQYKCWEFEHLLGTFRIFLCSYSYHRLFVDVRGTKLPARLAVIVLTESFVISRLVF